MVDVADNITGIRVWWKIKPAENVSEKKNHFTQCWRLKKNNIHEIKPDKDEYFQGSLLVKNKYTWFAKLKFAILM